MKTCQDPTTVFFGTPEFGAAILRKLVQADLKPVLVVTPPDKPKGRKQELCPCEAKRVALEYAIPLLETESFGDAVVKELLNIEPDLFLVASYGKILPKQVLEIPKKGSLNVHPSLLPKYRGASPVQEAILQGEEKTGITIILMDEKIDHGPIVVQKELPESVANFTTQELKARLADLGGDLLIRVIPQWMEGKIEPVLQDESKATFTKIIRKEQGRIDWKKEAGYIERQIRAFHPWPGTFTFFDGKILKILKAKVIELSQHSPPGTVFPFQEKFAVATGKGALLIEELQLEGGKPMSSKDFLLGHKDFLNSKLN